MSSSSVQKEKEAYQERERLEKYDADMEKFKADGKQLQSQQKLDKNYTKLDFIHYVVILSIFVSIIGFCLFLILTYVPVTKPYVMKVIDTVLAR